MENKQNTAKAADTPSPRRAIDNAQGVGVKRLVRTPAPHLQESPIGFLLRLAEANGFEDVKPLTVLATQRAEYFITVGWDYEKLRPLLGEEGLPKNYGYRSKIYTRGRGRLEGHPIATHHLGIIRSRICPDCVQTLGYIPSTWDLKAYLACHIHGRMMLKLCPSCGIRLTYRRRGLLLCKCGSSFANAELPHAPRELIAVSELLHAKVTGDRQMLAACIELGIPAADLLDMDLDVICRTIVGIAEVFTAMSCPRAGRRTDSDVASLLPEIGRALSNWPNNFHQLCREWQDFRRASGQYPHVFQTCFSWLFVGLHKNLRTRRHQTVVLLKAALEYGYESWDMKSIVVREPGLRRIKFAPARYGPYREAARILGISERTARRRLAQHRLPAIFVGGVNKRAIVDLDKVRQLSSTQPATLDERCAARRIGISRPLFSLLRKEGQIKTFTIGLRKPTSTFEDVDEFKASIVGMATSAPRGRLCPLTKVLWSKIPTDEKWRLICDITWGIKKVYFRRKKSKIADLWVDADTMHESAIRAQDFAGLIYTNEMVARFDLTVAEARAIALHVMGNIHRRNTKICLPRVQQFLSAHLPLRNLSKTRAKSFMIKKELATGDGSEIVVCLPTGIKRHGVATFIKKEGIRRVEQLARKGHV